MSAAFRTAEGVAAGVIKLEFYPRDASVSYWVQYCTAENATVEVKDVLDYSESDLKEMNVSIDVDHLTVECEGKMLVLVTFSKAVEQYSGKYLSILPFLVSHKFNFI